MEMLAGYIYIYVLIVHIHIGTPRLEDNPARGDSGGNLRKRVPQANFIPVPAPPRLNIWSHLRHAAIMRHNHQRYSLFFRLLPPPTPNIGIEIIEQEQNTRVAARDIRNCWWNCESFAESFKVSTFCRAASASARAPAGSCCTQKSR